MVPEAAEGKSLAKVRTPGVSIVTLVVKAAPGAEVGAWPVVTTTPLLRMSASWVRGVRLSAVGTEDQRGKNITRVRGRVLGTDPSSPHGCLDAREGPVLSPLLAWGLGPALPSDQVCFLGRWCEEEVGPVEKEETFSSSASLPGLWGPEDSPLPTPLCLVTSRPSSFQWVKEIPLLGRWTESVQLLHRA